MTRGLTWAIVVAVATIGRAGEESGRRPSPTPVVAGVVPPGGQVGTTVAWTIVGRGLEKVERVLVSGAGVEVVGLETGEDERAVVTLAIAVDAAPGFRELRLDGPTGVSNLAVVRVDDLPQSAESEPNDAPGQASPIAVGSAVAGTLRSTDVDHFRIEGTPGREITLDLEARRLGTSISPVLSALNVRGASIAQARESRSSDHDARLAVRFPKDGVLIAQVRDNTYGGGDAATYRLRVTTSPFATGLFPLGGEAGKSLALSVSGGSLKAPLVKTVTLPDRPGELFDPGPFTGSAGPVDSPMRVMIEDAREGRPSAEGSPNLIRVGQTVDGLIARNGAVDRYAMSVKKGERFQIRVEAEPMGSWLDSVLTVRDASGRVVAENDDSTLASDRGGRGGVNVLGLSEGTTDSLLDFTAGEAGPITIEVADRYGDGGPEFGYRLSVGASRPGLECFVLINANEQALAAAARGQLTATPGLFGVFNLRPGQRVPVNFLVIPRGRPGPVTVRAEGLPEGITAEPVEVDMLGPGPTGGSPRLIDAMPRAGALILRVTPHASPGLGEFRVVATAEPEPGRTITRTASATIALGASPARIGARPLTRHVDRFPIRVIGRSQRRDVGPPEESKLRSIRAPGVLLQGDRIDLALEFDASPLPDPGFSLEAKAIGDGLTASPVMVRAGRASDDEDEGTNDMLAVRVTARPEARPGVHPITISHRMTGGATRTTEAVVIVRAPVALLSRAEEVAIEPGGSATVWVGVRREVGCIEVVDVRIEALPAGVRQAGPVTLRAAEAEGLIRLEMAGDSRPVGGRAPVRVVGVVRMPGGAVAVESGNRPMIVARPAE